MPDEPIPLHQILEEEYEALHGALPPEYHETNKTCDQRLAAIIKKVHELVAIGRPRAAICLSGGGIRSATFGLGVLQGLSRHRLLRRFHYLSTVSGGGYIGSWLSAWITRHPGGLVGVEEQLANQGTVPTGSAERILNPEPRPIKHLRNYSNYLSPKLGLLSADSWTLAATYIRNLLLNWLVLVPMLGAMLMVPRFLVAILNRAPVESRSLWLWLFFALGAIGALIATAYVGWNRPSTTDSRRGQTDFLIGCLLPLALSAVFLTTYWSWLRRPKAEELLRERAAAMQKAPEPSSDDKAEGRAIAQLPTTLSGGERGPQLTIGVNIPESESARPVAPPINSSESVENQVSNFFGIKFPSSRVPFLMYGVLTHLTGWFFYGLRKPKTNRAVASPRYRLFEFLLILATGVVAGLLAWLSAARLFPDPSLHSELYCTLAAPLYLVLFLLSLTLFAGLSSLWTSDEDREWWARMGAWVLIVCAAWAVLNGTVIFGPAAISKIPEYLASLGGISGIITLVLGRGSSTPATEKKPGTGPAAHAKHIAATLAAPVFALFLVASLSALTSLLLVWLSHQVGLNIDRGWSHASQFRTLPDGIFSHLKVVLFTPWWFVLTVATILAVISFLLAAVINANKFSMHAMYRNRLIRAYLGASRPDGQRTPNLFTGFDHADNPSMTDLWPQPATVQDSPPQPNALLHVVNIALNLVSGEELGWQERKAESFTATPLHCGNRKLGYRRSAEYGGPGGISLGTAITISGAAVNPNMGYHSSPVVSFILTLFNVRLGAWLGNPGKAGNKTYRSKFPSWPARTTIEEAFGLTTDTNPYVNLSDGGHFDNLGLHEMILRRCHFIVISDAGCDVDFTFEDLGNAVRKVRIDMGVPVEFYKPFRLYSRSEKELSAQGRYCAVGLIKYSEIDGEEAPDGLLVYIKPAVYGNEPRDVYQYARQNELFQHQPTSDQFFSESQFESYRKLGLCEVEDIQN